MPFPPTITPARRRVHRKRHVVASPTVAPVTVIGVTAEDATHLRWKFSADVAGSVPGDIPELQASDNVGSGMVSPIECELTDHNEIFANYDGVNFLADGFSWQVLTPPAGVSFVGGGTLVVPEYG